MLLALKFIEALHDVSRRNPSSWRRVTAIGARTGIKGAQLEQVVADVVAAGLVDRRVDDPSLIILTNKGWTFSRHDPPAMPSSMPQARSD